MANFKSPRVIASVTIYLAGMTSLFCVDIYIAASFADKWAAEWALLKGIIFIGAPIILLGVDHVFVRQPEKVYGTYLPLILQIILGATCVSALVSTVFDLEAWKLQVSLISYSVVVMHFSIHRAQLKLVFSQLVFQFWKPCLLILVVFVNTLGCPASKIQLVDLVVLVLTGSCVGTVIIYVFLNRKSLRFEFKNISQLIVLGKYFAIAAILLNLSLYGEQLLVNFFATPEEAALLFRHSSAILPFTISLNGFVYFLLGPFVKSNTVAAIELWKARVGHVYVGVLTLFIASLFFGYCVFKVFYSVNTLFIWDIALMICLVAAFRTLFMFPSSLIAVRGDSADFLRFTLQNVFAIVSYICVFFVAYSFTNDAVQSVLMGSIANWCIRTVGAFVLAREISYRFI